MHRAPVLPEDVLNLSDNFGSGLFGHQAGLDLFHDPNSCVGWLNASDYLARVLSSFVNKIAKVAAVDVGDLIVGESM